MLHRNLRVERFLNRQHGEPTSYFSQTARDVLWMISTYTSPEVFQGEFQMVKLAEIKTHKMNEMFGLIELADESLVVQTDDGVHHVRREPWVEDRDTPFGITREEQKVVFCSLCPHHQQGFWGDKGDPNQVHQYDPATWQILSTKTLTEDLATSDQLVLRAKDYFLRHDDFRVAHYDENHQMVAKSIFTVEDYKIYDDWIIYRDAATYTYRRAPLPLGSGLSEILAPSTCSADYCYNPVTHEFFIAFNGKIYVYTQDKTTQWQPQLVFDKRAVGGGIHKMDLRPNGHLLLLVQTEYSGVSVYDLF